MSRRNSGNWKQIRLTEGSRIRDRKVSRGISELRAAGDAMGMRTSSLNVMDFRESDSRCRAL